MKLVPVLDLSAARPLWIELCAATGTPLSIDASAVERLGGACLQVLLAASARWRAEGLAFSITGASPVFVDAVGLMSAHELAPEETGQ